MKLKFHPRFPAGALAVLTVAGLTTTVFAGESSAIVDSIAFGDSNSETNHAFTASRGEIITGGLNEPARILLPMTNGAWEGGRLVFTLKVDPQKQNDATVRLWDSDATENQLVLFCEGGLKPGISVDIIGKPNTP